MAHVDVERRRCLDRVDVDQRAALGSRAADQVGDRLERSDLVVRQLQRHQDGLLIECRGQLVRLDAAVAIDRQDHDLEAELLQVGSSC